MRAWLKSWISSAWSLKHLWPLATLAAGLGTSAIFGATGGKKTEFQIACMTLPYAAFPLARALEGPKSGGYAYVSWGTTHREESGKQDPVLGLPVMELMCSWIRGCPEPMVLEQAGHFVQEHGASVAQEAVRVFGHG